MSADHEVPASSPRVATFRLTAPFLPIAAALFCIQLDFFSLSLALPTIAADLGTRSPTCSGC